MKFMLKSSLKKVSRTFGLEVIRLTQSQSLFLRNNEEFHYRDLVIQEAMAPRGEISVAEAAFLGNLVKDLKDEGAIIEIGTLFGRSTLVMACHKSLERELITVDNYSWNPLGISADAHYRITGNILSQAIDELNVQQVKSDKSLFYSNYHEPSPALVFFDAVHTYEETKADIVWAKQVQAGIVCGHDYHPENHPEVVRVVDEFGGPKELVETLWVL